MKFQPCLLDFMKSITPTTGYMVSPPYYVPQVYTKRPIQPFKDWLAALDPADAKARTAAEHMAEYNTTFLPAARVNSRKAYNICLLRTHI